MKLLSTVAVLCLAAATSAAHAADPRLGRNLAATCANCHGPNGHAVKDSGIAALAGLDQATLVQKLADFKSGRQPATIMQQIAKGYSDEQLALIATYFAAQK